MEYKFLGNHIKLLFREKKDNFPNIDADFNYNIKKFVVTIWVNRILNFNLDENLELNQSLLHKDLINKYKEKAIKENLDFLQVVIINEQYCFLVDSWNWLVLMHRDEY